ncbi:MAG TPA: MASE1 domain-containing protein [Solirubrobacteraceae bacterium]|nr:MASE1 domain-containing protein [Solirubrobacteraceae bacterium]
MAGVAWAVRPLRTSARRLNRPVDGQLQLGYRRAGYLPRVALVVALYYAAAHIGYAFEFAGPVAAIVWLPVGVGIAALYLLGLRLWPGIVVGDLLVNNYSALPVGSALGQSFGNLLEVVIAVLLLRRLVDRDAPLSTISSVTGVFVAIAAGTLVSATIGSLSLRFGHVVSTHSLLSVWRTWWLGDFCGAALVLPLALAWFPFPGRQWRRREILEGILVLALVYALSMIAIKGGHHLNYLAFPALIWAGLRFGPRGATLAISISAAVMIWGTTHYLGPFAVGSINESLLEIQTYLAVTTVSALAVAALARERELLAARVRASRTRIVVAADEERRRLERDLHDGAQQRLVALAVRLGLTAERERSASEETAASFEAARAEVMEAVDEIREIVHGIHPATLRRFGLARAIEEVAARSVTPIVLIELPQVRLDETAEVTAYYVILEAVTNAQRHARASTIRVRARLADSVLTLEVRDNGIGGAVERDAFGIQGLRDRVEATGGRFAIQSEPGGGTRIVARIPADVAGPAR